MTMTANSQGPVQRARRVALLNYFSLFSSFSILICCALPSVLVLLGMGTTVASLLSAAPWLVSLSRRKIWTFSIAGVLIAMSFVMTYLIAPRLREGEVCDADDPTTCGEVSKISRAILWGSAVIWSCGFFVAYLLGPILELKDREAKSRCSRGIGPLQIRLKEIPHDVDGKRDL